MFLRNINGNISCLFKRLWVTQQNVSRDYSSRINHLPKQQHRILIRFFSFVNETGLVENCGTYNTCGAARQIPLGLKSLSTAVIICVESPNFHMQCVFFLYFWLSEKHLFFPNVNELSETWCVFFGCSNYLDEMCAWMWWKYGRANENE
jgi:hypothetical protein